MTDSVFVIPGDLNSPTGGYTYDRRVLALMPSLGVSAEYLKLPGAYPAPSPSDLDEARKLIDRTPGEAKLVIDGLAFAVLPPELLASLGDRIVALVHHPLALENGLSPSRVKALQTSERVALAYARDVIVTSTATGKLLSDSYGVDPRRITVAEPGTDPTHRASGTGTPLQILAVGSILERKAYDVLVQALEPIKTLDWRLTIVGALDRDSQAVERLNVAISKAGFGDRVLLPGVVVPATLDRYYDNADVFVMASHFEGYGMVLAEAMARGLTIVTTTGGACGETVPDGAALKVASGDVDELSMALGQVLRDRKLRVKLADAAWDVGRHLPTWNETARRVAAVIMDLRA